MGPHSRTSFRSPRKFEIRATGTRAGGCGSKHLSDRSRWNLEARTQIHPAPSRPTSFVGMLSHEGRKMDPMKVHYRSLGHLASGTEAR